MTCNILFESNLDKNFQTLWFVISELSSYGIHFYVQKQFLQNDYQWESY